MQKVARCKCKIYIGDISERLSFSLTWSWWPRDYESYFLNYFPWLEWNWLQGFWMFACCKLVFASNFLRGQESVIRIFWEEFVGSHQTRKAGCNSHSNHFDDFSNMLKTAPQGICERRAPTDFVIYQNTKRARYNTGTALMFWACWSNLIRSRNLKCAETEFTPFFEVIKVQTKFGHSFSEWVRPEHSPFCTSMIRDVAPFSDSLEIVWWQIWARGSFMSFLFRRAWAPILPLGFACFAPQAPICVPLIVPCAAMRATWFWSATLRHTYDQDKEGRSYK